MQHKVIITKNQSTINEWLDKGWEVVSVTAQYSVSSTWNEGAFCFVLAKQSK